MSHAAEAPDPGWPSMLPPGREPEPPEADRTAREAEPADDDELFGDWEPRRRVNRLTVVLAAAALVVAGFATGAVIGKRSGEATPSAAAAAATRFGAAGGGAAGGAAGREGFTGFGGAGGFAGGRGAGGTGGAGGAASGGGTAAGAGAAGGGAGGGTPVVVGTVESVAADHITVQNFAGATVVVQVPAGTPVTTRGLHGLSKGQTVSVEGTRSSDGTVTASSVVSRS